LALIILVVSEKRAFEHFHISIVFSETTGPIGTKLSWNVPWMVLYKVSGIKKNRNLAKDIPMIIHLQFGFSQFISFREEDL
jgi:hypothetical protein